VITDVSGLPIAMTLYRGDAALVTVEIEPLRALALAGELIEAARRRLAAAARWKSAPRGEGDLI
jgi:hypothetical protein